MTEQFKTTLPTKTNPSFLKFVLRGFASNAVPHHHFSIKAHPSEDSRSEIAYHLKRLGAQFDINWRIHYLPGGKLAHVLDPALSVVTVDSTAFILFKPHPDVESNLRLGALPKKTIQRSAYDCLKNCGAAQALRSCDAVHTGIS
jgi:hypothetical protein